MNNIEQSFAEAKQWFDAIAQAVGKQKQEVIKQCEAVEPRGNSDAWRLLLIYMNPMIVFHIGKKSLEEPLKEVDTDFQSVYEFLNFMAEKSALSNSDLAAIQSTIMRFESKTIEDFCRNYICRTLKVGITASTINKTFHREIIRTFGCMLANKYFEHISSVIGKQIAVTEKLDGIRAVTIVKDPANLCTIEIRSRQGQLISGLVDVEAAIKETVKRSEIQSDFVLDGELLISDRENIPSKEQYKRTIKIVRADTNNDKHGIQYNVFDTVNLEEFQKGESLETYDIRRDKLDSFSKQITDNNSLRVVPIEEVFSFTDEDRALSHITQLVTVARHQNKEGVMLNVVNAPYQCKRTNNLLKVKVFQDCDLEIIGFQEGTGKLEGTLGALVVEYKGNPVGVGTGLSDADRLYFWNNQDSLLGRIATIQYFEETCNADGKKSIRFPVFKELREYGKEVSYN